MKRKLLPQKLYTTIELVIRVLEIALSLFLLAGVVTASVMMLGGLHHLMSAGNNASFQQFLDDALLYIIGLEVALMLIKHDLHLVVDILIFAIARKMIMTMTTGADFLLGAIAILVLYTVKSNGFRNLIPDGLLWGKKGKPDENL
ncbi:hypothetical protein [Alicyclobacillus sp. SO9]|uniref:hypothetical protein n=1 Tax=Alicyclobacillus sp. SO9 TaxID=2665646 RepID=UPI0018E7536A|nr:hypothetical protein [Alicyclobacillus sp. SO9]QQE78062.1 hypothetical protein GI364_19530 [Alicyclobacillus sp. SO9]